MSNNTVTTLVYDLHSSSELIDIGSLSEIMILRDKQTPADKKQRQLFNLVRFPHDQFPVPFDCNVDSTSCDTCRLAWVEHAVKLRKASNLIVINVAMFQ